MTKVNSETTKTTGGIKSTYVESSRSFSTPLINALRPGDRFGNRFSQLQSQSVCVSSPAANYTDRVDPYGHLLCYAFVFSIVPVIHIFKFPPRRGRNPRALWDRPTRCCLTTLIVPVSFMMPRCRLTILIILVISTMHVF